MKIFFVETSERLSGLTKLELSVEVYEFFTERNHINDSCKNTFRMDLSNQEDINGAYAEVLDFLKKLDGHVVFKTPVRYNSNGTVGYTNESSHIEKIRLGYELLNPNN